MNLLKNTIMRLFRLSILLLCFTFSFSILFAQNEVNYIKGDVLVKIDANADIQQIVNDLQRIGDIHTEIAIVKEVIPSMYIWLLHYNDSNIEHSVMLTNIKSHPNIKIAQSNHKIEYRNTPNDAQFSNQWQYINTGQSGGTIGADMDADSAWDITTGGLTALGDTIVVCIIDGGIDVNHNDLTPNRWVNWAEIPNNNIDDDNNGYVDDYLGWNTLSVNGNIAGTSHGTAVAGIIGAKGNNGIGVTGVNWDVKLMIVRGGTGQEVEVLQAYSYALDARKKYNETNGAEGAFVVATNASWGVNGGQAASAPLWCAMYDTLGKYGILNAGAGPNLNVNVDNFGDLPTTCPSEYLIGVTNLDHNDLKVTQAGYGLTHIDLGAHGEGTWTTTGNGGYSSFGGTSGATPHVTGTIALLYSSPCPSLAALAKVEPQLATEWIRDFIFNNLDTNTSIAGITALGGRLNAYKAIKDLMENCPPPDCIPPYALTISNVIDTSMTISWNAIVDTTRSFNLKYRILGDTVWNVLTDTLMSLDITGLSACTEYQVQIEMACDSSMAQSPIYLFKTKGCCIVPSGISSITNSDTSATIAWNSVFAANNYILRYRLEGTTAWLMDSTSNNSLTIDDLQFCSTYEYQLQTACDTGYTLFSSIKELYTGCGNCTHLTYCNANGSTQFEWIESISINGNTFITGNNNGKYIHRGLATSLDKAAYSLTVEPGYTNTPFSENVNAWIDYNQDGDFDDAGELIVQFSGISAAATLNFAVPATAAVGITRMRIMLEYNNNPQNCSSGIDGEVEDYCIEITNVIACNLPTNLDTVGVGLDTLDIQWAGAANDSVYIIRYRLQNASSWTYASSSTNSYVIPNLSLCNLYEVEVAAICNAGDTSAYVSAVFGTRCVNAEDIIQPEEWNVQVFPNPFSEVLNINLNLKDKQNITVELLNITGQLIKTQQFGERTGEQQLQFSTAEINSSGIYILKIITDRGAVVQKLVKR